MMLHFNMLNTTTNKWVDQMEDIQSVLLQENYECNYIRHATTNLGHSYLSSQLHPD